ncbi:hypothetical protein NDU88_000688, partial [Pleurodeles waltl]
FWYSQYQSSPGVPPEVLDLHQPSRGRRVQCCKSHASCGELAGFFQGCWKQSCSLSWS